MPGVIVPQQRDVGLLSTVMKGLSIARDIYGIKQAGEASDRAQQELDLKNQATDDEKQGVISAKEHANLIAGGATDVPEGTAGAAKFQTRDADGNLSPLYVRAKQAEAKTPLLQKIETVENGQKVTKFVNATPDASYPAAPDKEAVPHYTTAGQDQSGSLVVLDSRTGKTKTVDTGPISRVGATDRTSHDQDKAYTEMINKLETPRGNQNVQQAQTALRAIANAQELISQYPDPNTMPPQQVNLLNQELAKVASGGVGSEHGQRSLEANTYNQRWQQFMSQVGNTPNGAQLGAFIKENERYLGGLEKVNKAVVNDYKTKIYNGYKNRLSQEQRDQFQAEYSDIFAAKVSPDQNAKATSGSPSSPMPRRAKSPKDNQWYREVAPDQWILDQNQSDASQKASFPGNAETILAPGKGSRG